MPAVAIYEAASAVAGAARSRIRRATRIFRYRGARASIMIAVNVDGWAWTGRDARLAAEARRARPAGVVLDATTKKGTIVSIRYAARRPARG